MDDLEIITTSDGSHTLRNKQLNETYHSIHGALQESMHVFIKNGLLYHFENHHTKNISILEVGFGTGLNALLTLQHAIQHHFRIRYTTLEPFPLREDVWSKLNYADSDKDKQHFKALHEAGWGSEIAFTPEFMILKLNTSLQEAQLNEVYDVIYFDAFAPAVQPELWVYETLEKVTALLKPGGVFVTYSAKGQLKRDLKSLGLKVETLPGPPGKNEMVRAVRV
ncbi:MAG: tRNA (5-methylaminomethyl-2-thiouridine)(34)-methyltransferase MnmD [Cyclobacteriaceae bacterium]